MSAIALLMKSLGVGEGAKLLPLLTPVAAKGTKYKGKPAVQTGIKELIAFGKKERILSPQLIMAIVPELQGIYGGYPLLSKGELIANVTLFLLFGVMSIVTFALWLVNTKRGHKFHHYICFSIYCILKFIGFLLRTLWSFSVADIPLGLASVVLVQVAPLILLTVNVDLAHRLFIWRHPEVGVHRVFKYFLGSIYPIVVVVVALAIIGESLPFLYFMEESTYTICKNIMKAGAILNVVYAALPLVILALAFIISPTKLFELLQTHTGLREIPVIHQPQWITGAGIGFYPAVRVDKVEGYVSDTVRIIPSRELPGRSHCPIRDSLRHAAPALAWAIGTVVVASSVLLACCATRAAACFYTGPWAQLNGSKMIIHDGIQRSGIQVGFYGGAELGVLAFYLLMRIDLRFYTQDRHIEQVSDMDDGYDEFSSSEKFPRVSISRINSSGRKK